MVVPVTVGPVAALWTTEKESITDEHILYEPRHEKTNKGVVRPAQTQISLGIRPVWSDSSLSA